MKKTLKLSTETIEFIYDLLSAELQREYINDNANNEEIEYVVDLIKASIEFANALGFIKSYAMKEEINELLK